MIEPELTYTGQENGYEQECIAKAWQFWSFPDDTAVTSENSLKIEGLEVFKDSVGLRNKLHNLPPDEDMPLEDKFLRMARSFREKERIANTHSRRGFRTVLAVDEGFDRHYADGQLKELVMLAESAQGLSHGFALLASMVREGDLLEY